MATVKVWFEAENEIREIEICEVTAEWSPFLFAMGYTEWPNDVDGYYITSRRNEEHACEYTATRA